MPISWRSNIVVEFATKVLRARFSRVQAALVLALAVFFLYWIIPAVLSGLEHTSCAADKLSAMVARLSNAFESTGMQHVAVAASSGRVLCYLNDHTHLLFSICLAAMVFFGTLLVDRIETFTGDLVRAGAFLPHESEALTLYKKCRALFRPSAWYQNSAAAIAIRCACALCAGVVFLFFHNFAQRPCGELQCWWGQAGHLAGVYYSIVIAAIVYLAAEALASILIGLGMINVLLRKGYAVPNLFARDLANGMSPIGEIVLLNFTLSVAGAFGVFIVLRIGYFGVENLLVVWTLIIAATLFVPLATLGPMFSAVYASSECRNQLLKSINSSFSCKMPSTDGSAADLEWLQSIQSALSLYRQVSELSVLPFDKYRAGISVGALAAVLAQTAYNLVKLFS